MVTVEMADEDVVDFPEPQLIFSELHLGSLSAVY
jgi:hypothetical protein